MRKRLNVAASVRSFALLATGFSSQASAAGNFDGKWNGKLECSEDYRSGGLSTESTTEITVPKFILDIRSGSVVSHEGILPSGNHPFKAAIKQNQI